MSYEILNYLDDQSRRTFLKKLSAGAAGLALGGVWSAYNARAAVATPGRGRVNLVTGTDPREVAYQSLKPFEEEIAKAIGDKQVLIKPNIGQVYKKDWLNASDVNQIRGILDFLKPIYDRKVIIGEGTATPETTTFEGYSNFGYTDLEREYNCRLIDLNDQPTVIKCIQAVDLHPLPVNIISTYLDPNVYLISATRFKNSGGMVVTLSLKNVVMGAPVHHYKQKPGGWTNEKHKIHSWKGQWSHKGQAINIFMLAQMGIVPDLAVLDGTIGMEGNGPVNGTPVEQGVGLAGTDWLAADRVATELMGYDWNVVKYLQWCGDAGMGETDLSKIEITGPDYRDYIIPYKHHKNYYRQVAWIDMDERKKNRKNRR